MVGITLSASDDPDLSPLHAWSQLARLSLAPLTRTSNSATGGNVALRGGRIDKRSALLLLSILDLVASLIILGGVVYARADIKHFAHTADAAVVEVRDFSVLLRRLPHDRRLHAEEVAAYLEAAVPGAKGKVASVVVARDMGEHLVALRTLQEAGPAPADDSDDDDDELRWWQCLTKRRRAARKARAKLEAQVAAFEELAAPVLGAYVTLDTVAARVAVQRALPRSAASRTSVVLRCAATRRFRKQHTLTAVQAPDPANVLWENQGVSAGRRLLLRLGSAASLFLLLLFTSALAVASKSAGRSQTTEVDCTASARVGMLDCGAIWPSQPDEGLAAALAAAGDASSCRDLVDPESAIFLVNQTRFVNASSMTRLRANMDRDTARAAGCAAQACYACFCSHRGLPAWTAGRDDAVRPWCNPHWQAWLRSAGLRVAAIIAALLGNIGGAVVHPRLTAFERHSTAAGADAVEARSIFLISFFNSFVVTLLVYADIRPLRPLRVVFNGSYADFTPVWYAQVGATLFLSCFMQAALPPIMCSLQTGVFRLRCKLLRRGAASQKQLDELAAGPVWRVSVRLGQAMQMLFFALAICGGMPGAFFVLLLFLPMLQLMDRAFMLRVCRAPPRYDGALITSARDVLPYAVWLHLALTAWMYGSPSLPSFEVRAFCEDGSPRSRFISARLCAANCWIHLVPCGLLTAALAVSAHANAAAAAGRAACCAADASGAHDEHADETFNLARAEGRLAGVLHSYSVHDNPAYAHLLQEDNDVKPPEPKPQEPKSAPAGGRRGANLHAASESREHDAAGRESRPNKEAEVKDEGAELLALPVRELKARVAQRGLDARHCIEKADFVELLLRK